MKKLICVIAALIILVVSAPALFASDITNALFYGNIIITNNGTAAAPVSVNCTINTQALIEGGYLNSTANNTVIRNSSGADVVFMPGWSGNDWMMWVPSIGDDSNLTYILYTANSTGGLIRWFPGTAGVTTSDNTTLELGNSFNIEWTGYVDTSAGANKDLVIKDNAFWTSVSAANTLASTISGGGLAKTETLSPDSPGLLEEWQFATSGVGLHWQDAVTQGDAQIITQTQVIAPPHTDLYNTDNSSVGVGLISSIDVRAHLAWVPAWPPTVIDISVYTHATQYNYPVVLLGGGAGLYYTENLATNPNTGLGWTWAEIDALQAGARVQTSNIAGPITLDLIDVTVNYNEHLTITAYSIASGEMTVGTEMALNNRPDIITDIPTTATVGVSFGSGVLPVAILQEQELTVDTATITFSNIDDLVARWDAIAGTTSRHLIVSVNAASPDAVSQRSVLIRLNGDSGNNYSKQYILGEGGAPGAGISTSASAWTVGVIPGTTLHADAFGGGFILFPNSFNTINHKAAVSLFGSADYRVYSQALRWASVDAIDTVLLYPDVGDFEAGSTFQLGVIDERYLVEEDILAADGSFDFAAIAGTGHDLVAVGYLRSDDGAAVEDEVIHELNADGNAANYPAQELLGRAGVTSAASPVNQEIGMVSADNATANAFGALLVSYAQYAEVTNDSHFLSLSGYHESTGATAEVRYMSGHWNNAVAITRVEYYPNTGVDFKAGSMMSLYRVPRYVIERVELTAISPTITFTNIPQGYESLQILVYGRSDLAALSEDVLISYNNDVVAANYDTQTLDGTGAVVTAVRNAASRTLLGVTAANEGANEFGGGVATINQYAKTDRHKHAIVIDGLVENSVFIRSLRWEDLSAITEIDLTLAGGNNFVAGTIVELVGLMPHSIFTLEVDSNIEAFDAAGTATVDDNINTWEYATNDVMPYVESITASGQVLHFDGTATSNVNAGAIHNNESKLWVSLWFKLDEDYNDTIGVHRYIYGKFLDNDNNSVLWLESTDGALHFKLETSAIQRFNIKSTQTSWNAGQRYHVLASISDVNAVRLIIDNGIPITNADLNPLPNGGDFTIGDFDDPGVGVGFIGVIAEFSCGTDDLTTAEETGLFNGIIPADANNIWYTDEGVGVIAVDYGTDGNNGAIDAACTWQGSAGINRLDYDIYLEGLITTTFTDRAASQQDGTATLRTSSSDPDVSAVLAGFWPISEAKAPDYVLGQAPPFIESTANITGNFTTVPPAGTFPLAPVITAIANATGTPPQLPLLIIACFIILAISLTISATMRRYGSGSIFVKIIGIACVMGVFVAIANFGIDFWMVVVFAIIGVALGMASKQIGWN